MTRLKALGNCHSILDLRHYAKSCLPRPIFDFLEGAAETEVTARRNTAAFDDVKVISRCLVDVGSVQTSTRVLGRDLEWPLLCSPTGASRLFHPDGELAIARATAQAGVMYGLSISSTHPLEAVAAASNGPKMFQLYLHKDREVMRELINRCKQAGFDALCLTVDVPAYGKRERDLRSGFSVNPAWTLRNIIDYASRPAWVFGLARKGPLRLAHSTAKKHGKRDRTQPDPSVTWKDVRDISDLWGGPFALKGVMSGDDACRAADAGITAVIVSNHGGRQLDGAAAAIEVLPEIVKAAGDRIEVILDGGVRRGVHILKALALGAKACAVGRPYLYGLSIAGEPGVKRALDILRAEFTLAMQLAGCPDLASIDSSRVRFTAVTSPEADLTTRRRPSREPQSAVSSYRHR